MDRGHDGSPFGVRSGDGRWWWNGSVWLEVPASSSLRDRRAWPPPGRYRRPGDGRLTYWDGSAWRVPNLRPWRPLATVLALAIGGLVFLVGTLGSMGDPGTGEPAKSVDSMRLLFAVALAAVPVTCIIVVLVNWTTLRRPIMRRDREPRGGA